MTFLNKITINCPFCNNEMIGLQQENKLFVNEDCSKCKSKSSKIERFFRNSRPNIKVEKSLMKEWAKK